MEKMKELFCPHIFRDIREIDSSKHESQVNQINDILLGSVLNEISDSQHKLKTQLRQHIIETTGVPSLGIDYWGKLGKTKADEIHPKMQVWVFRPGIGIKNTKKAREM